MSEDNGNQNNGYTVPAHLKDLQEADLPENQRGIVLSEIAQFRERAAKKEKDKMERDRERLGPGPGRHPPSGPAAPQGPRHQREWGKPQGQSGPSTPTGPDQQRWGHTSQGYNGKPSGFVRGSEDVQMTSPDKLAEETEKSDEDLERERRQVRARQEEISFRDVSPQINGAGPNAKLLVAGTALRAPRAPTHRRY